MPYCKWATASALASPHLSNGPATTLNAELSLEGDHVRFHISLARLAAVVIVYASTSAAQDLPALHSHDPMAIDTSAALSERRNNPPACPPYIGVPTIKRRPLRVSDDIAICIPSLRQRIARKTQ